ncbi:hypothetical protein ACLB2K_072704 [Fragaria x ananassa]
MVWCSACVKNVKGTSDAGRLWRSGCGKVLEDHIFSQEPTFVKNATGQSQLVGRYVRSRESEISASRERILENAEYELRCMRNALDMGDNKEIIDIAKRFYRIAIERNSTRGRKSEQVQAACLYIACCYVLGAVFLQLCKALRLDEHPIFQKLVDPSWFIHRFTENRQKTEWNTWCCALYISALSHGIKCAKSDIIEEFLVKARELDGINKQPIMADKMDNADGSLSEQRILCEHKDSGKPWTLSDLF